MAGLHQHRLSFPSARWVISRHATLTACAWANYDDLLGARRAVLGSASPSPPQGRWALTLAPLPRGMQLKHRR